MVTTNFIPKTKLNQSINYSATRNGEAERVAGHDLLVINGGIVSPPDYQTRYINNKKRFALQKIARDLLPDENINGCLRYRKDVNAGVAINYSAKFNSAHFSNLQTCGMSWICPVCSAKISERRRVELKCVTDKWLHDNKGVFMVTFTLQHNVNDKLAFLIECQNCLLYTSPSPRD